MNNLFRYLTIVYLLIFSFSCDQRSPVDGDDAGGGDEFGGGDEGGDEFGGGDEEGGGADLGGEEIDFEEPGEEPEA